MATGAASGRGNSAFVRIAKQECQDLTDQMHLLPCCIKYNGSCDVSAYFKPKPCNAVVDGIPLKEAFLRGRKLAGATVPVPQNYCGYVLHRMKGKNDGNSDKECTAVEQEADIWNATSSFRNITYWNHDTLPSETDMFTSCFHWFSVANAMHATVTVTALDSELNTSRNKNGPSCGQKRKGLSNALK